VRRYKRRVEEEAAGGEAVRAIAALEAGRLDLDRR